MNRYCTYLRVSTQKQGHSGLGIDAQRNMCSTFIQNNNGVNEQEFVDIESGTHRDRKGLWDAIDYCKANGTGLVIAKLDRLARDVEFTFKVINTGIDIHFCDMPVVNSMILGVFASVAQYERELISDRTKKALAVKKEQGCKLGAASPIYQERYKLKSSEERVMEHRKKGVTKNSRFLQKKDTVAFLKVLTKVFPEACVGEPTEWQWHLINTKEANREKIIEVMNTFKEIDPTLFPKWNLSGDEAMSTKTQVKMANQITTLRRSVLRNETINNTLNR